MIPPSFIQDLLARVDLVDVVGGYVELKRTGANFIGLCPFHGEKSPSFTVTPSKQFYHCFGCGAHGNALDFLMEHLGLGFIEAVQDLAQKCGLAVPQENLSPEQRDHARSLKEKQSTLTDVLERAADFYKQQLKSSPRAVDYLKRRGLTGQVAARFNLGYAPQGWRSLAGVFARYDDPLLTESGLIIVQGEDEADQKRYDRFRDRIMFPIRSVQGQVIGFGGRVLDQGEPKYLNSPETPVFVKGRELYGLFEARTALRENGYALVVEGYMDVVALAQLGYANAVATLGTACTPDHVHKLLRFTDKVIFSFDGDAAGRRAAQRAMEASLPHATDVRSFRFLFLPAEHDPDSYVREHGPDAFEQLVHQAVPLSRQMIDTASADCELNTPEGRARLLAQAKPYWQALPEAALKRQLLGELATLAKLEVAELTQVWTAPSPSQPQSPGSPAPRFRVDGGVNSRSPRRPTSRAPVRGPADHVARMVMSNSHWWQDLSHEQHESLCALQTWHGDFFRWLDRWLSLEGPCTWSALKEAAATAAWLEPATALQEGADFQLDAVAEDLVAAVNQVMRAEQIASANRVLGR